MTPGGRPEPAPYVEFHPHPQNQLGSLNDGGLVYSAFGLLGLLSSGGLVCIIYRGSALIHTPAARH